MLLHLVNDEKFLNGIISLFEIINPNQNEYLIIVNSLDFNFKYLKDHDRVHVIKYKSRKYLEIIRNISQFEVVLIHFLDSIKADIINKSPKGICFVWMIWGGDAYRLFDYKLYDEETFNLLINIKPKWKFSRKIATGFFLKLILKKKKIFKRLAICKAIKRIHFCTTVIPEEYYLFKEKLPLSAKYIPFNYINED